MQLRDKDIKNVHCRHRRLLGTARTLKKVDLGNSFYGIGLGGGALGWLWSFGIGGARYAKERGAGGLFLGLEPRSYFCRDSCLSGPVPSCC